MRDSAFLLSRKQTLINWAAAYPYAAVFDSNGYDDRYGEYDLLIAVSHHRHDIHVENVFKEVEKLRQNNNWLFGYFGYDLKNQIENLSSKNPDKTGFPESFFFTPEKLIAVKRNGEVLLEGLGEVEVEQVCGGSWEVGKSGSKGEASKIAWQSRFSKEDYIKSVAKIQQHIQRGDIYETNFCQEFYAENSIINPAETFISLTKKSPVPFAAFLRMEDKYAISLSPERFLCRRNELLVSQPIKGTAVRGFTFEEDEKLKTALQNNPKERAENIMITDLVRNDMTRSAEENTVQVEELCRVYSYPSVHQMISTITGKVNIEASNVEMVKNIFPMGSMTGAPKIKAMQLMENFERSKRGLYSGALGYFAPDGNFDFNVVIRTLIYDAKTGYLSYHTGSAITHLSNPEKEYEECLLKRKVVEMI